jgi:hypothetical protein
MTDFKSYFDENKERVFEEARNTKYQDKQLFVEEMKESIKMLDKITKLPSFVPNDFKQYLTYNLEDRNIGYTPLRIAKEGEECIKYQSPELIKFVWHNYVLTKIWLRELEKFNNP